jgi:predicted glycosyltransferase involved in capsule biosynthesis
MYVLAGSDAMRLSMNEKFVGWGGEDNDFFQRVAKKLNIIRHREKGLTHVWHPKGCHLGSFVENDFFKSW